MTTFFTAKQANFLAAASSLDGSQHLHLQLSLQLSKLTFLQQLLLLLWYRSQQLYLRHPFLQLSKLFPTVASSCALAWEPAASSRASFSAAKQTNFPTVASFLALVRELAASSVASFFAARQSKLSFLQQLLLPWWHCLVVMLSDTAWWHCAVALLGATACP